MNAIYQIVEQIWSQKFTFLLTFFLVFTLTYAVLFVVDFLPEEPVSDVAVLQDDYSYESETVATIDTVEAITVEGPDKDIVDMATPTKALLPLTISIERLDKTITVLNPVSRTIEDLDNALLDGVVRHPDSATLNQEGNMFILGHSSYLPNVFNKNFQAFNGIEDLEWGDTIEVTSEDGVFEYRVDKVYRANAQELVVPIAGTGHNLTLATCNSFGSVDDRYIVEATRIDVRAL